MIEVLFEDERLLVVNKPAGRLVVAAPGRTGKTVVDLLTTQLGRRAYAVHRLDEETTGVLLLAKDQESKRALEALFATHAIERVYEALVTRAPSPRAGRIESLLAEDARGIVRSVARGGERAITHYRIIGRRGSNTLVECRLETGRRNQIRVHLAELGSPIVGDRKYGYRGSARTLMLHARSVEFVHPFTGERVRVAAATGPARSHRP